MFQHQGIWLPDGEKHFPEWMTRNGEVVDGKGTYQIKKLRAAMKWVKQFRLAVDIGAHVGLWSMHLAQSFRELHAFEPVDSFRACWSRNVVAQHAYLYPAALGDEEGAVVMSINAADTGGTHVASMAKSGGVPLYPLDHFSFNEVDFIKIDCEGYEDRIIKGATDTLVRCRPCVIVEQKPHKLSVNYGIKGHPAVDLLVALGAKVRTEMGGDYILSWD
jgi:FkbM family methyltransferase